MGLNFPRKRGFYMLKMAHFMFSWVSLVKIQTIYKFSSNELNWSAPGGLLGDWATWRKRCRRRRSSLSGKFRQDWNIWCVMKNHLTSVDNFSWKSVVRNLGHTVVWFDWNWLLGISNRTVTTIFSNCTEWRDLIEIDQLDLTEINYRVSK